MAALAASVALWGACGLVLLLRRPREPMGAILLASTALSGGGLLAHATDTGGGALIGWVALALMPSLAMHTVLGLPDGRLRSRALRLTVWSYHALSVALGVVLWSVRPGHWIPVAISTVVAASIAIPGSVARYSRTRGLDRQRMQWFGWSVAVSGVLGTMFAATWLLANLRSDSALFAAIVAAPVPLSFVIASSRRSVARIDRILAHTVSIGGLTALIVVTYVLVIVGLGRVPEPGERTLLLLSMAAAAVAAMLYIPTRERLSAIANRIVYGELHAPDEVLRTFGSRLSRAIPLDELLLQMAESLRKTFSLNAVEVWTGSDGVFERTVSDPDRGSGVLHVGEKEQPVVARAGVSGRTWITVWLPALLERREDAMIRVAPIAHSGELLGLIVIERAESAGAFGDENELVLSELARQVALALHNVQLDSALQASLDELRQQAEDLRASRERVVAAGDAERRKFERNLHDGAQQHLVALKVNLRLAENVADDPAAVKQMLQSLAHDVQETIEEVRRLSHGIFPKVLIDRGVGPALEAAAARAALPVEVDAVGIERCDAGIETAVYFCCLEALQNAGKHAGDGAQATISLRMENGVLVFEVADDGAGFDGSNRGSGAGFVNMSDRIGAVGGKLDVWSAPGQGTRITGRIPLSVPVPPQN